MPRSEGEARREAQLEPEKPAPATNPRNRLQQLLAPHIELLQMGIPAREVEALIRTDEPRFSAKTLGFEDFTALLDFAEAEELLRSIPDDRNLLRFKPGDALTVPFEAEESPAAEETGGAETRSAPRRRRRRRNASRLSKDDEGDEGVSEDSSESADEAPPVEESAEAAPEAAAVRKKAAKRKTAKKSVKKAAKKTAAKRTSTDDSDDEA